MFMKKSLMLLMLNFYCLSVYACEEDQFNRYFDDGNDTEAYELLKDCEPLKNLSSDTLERIAALYYRTDLISFSSENDRVRKVYEIYLYAALQGGKGGVFWIEGLLETGDQDLSVEPQKEKAECLYPFSYLDEGDVLPAGIVEHCLGGTDISVLGL
jgi:hypothetical protein